MPSLWTVGHSTRGWDEFVAILHAHHIQLIADVRRYPASRRYPHFNASEMAGRLKDAGIEYRHIPELGGRRTARADSINLGWRNAGFRGYADYMQTEAFRESIDALLVAATHIPTAVMCSEAVPWRCHRSLVADMGTVRGWSVQHILSATEARPHAVTPFARVVDGRLTYPATQTDRPPARSRRQ